MTSRAGSCRPHHASPWGVVGRGPLVAKRHPPHCPRFGCILPGPRAMALLPAAQLSQHHGEEVLASASRLRIVFPYAAQAGLPMGTEGSQVAGLSPFDLFPCFLLINIQMHLILPPQPLLPSTEHI